MSEQPERELTYGEKAAGVSFNPSNNPHVDAIKRKFADTIDYSKVVARVREILDDHDAQLLEALAELIATTLLREFGMPRLRLSLAKLNLMPGVKKLGISIERRPGTAGQAPGTGSDAGSGPAR